MKKYFTRLAILLLFLTGSISSSFSQLKYVSNIRNTTDVANMANPEKLAMSPDEKQLYVISGSNNALHLFTRSETGSLTLKKTLKEGTDVTGALTSPKDVAVSPDGKYVYVSAAFNNSISVFKYDPSTESLTYQSKVTEGTAGVDGITYVTQITLTPDGKYIYAISVNEGAISVFSRNDATGALTFVQKMIPNVANDSYGSDPDIHLNALEVSPDGKYLFTATWDVNFFASSSAAGDDVSYLARYQINQSTGQLTYETSWMDETANFLFIAGVRNLRFTADGKFLYVVSNQNYGPQTTGADEGISVYKIDAAGNLTFVTAYRQGYNGITNLAGAADIQFRKDGKYAWTVANTDDNIVMYARDPSGGYLNYVNALKDASIVDSKTIDGLDGATSLVVTADGKHQYVAAYIDNAISLFENKAKTYYVKKGGAGLQDGSSWGNALPEAWMAFGMVKDRDIVYISKGTYHPHASDRSYSFYLVDSVEVYGGFAGSETDIDQTVLDARDFRQNETILSGDLGNNDANGLYTDNSYRVVIAIGTSSTKSLSKRTILDGFTITGGAATGTGNQQRGGGIYVDAGTFYNVEPVFKNLTIHHNRAVQGGAIFCNSGEDMFSGSMNGNALPEFYNCTIADNVATGGGSAVYNKYQNFRGIASPLFVNVIVYNHTGIPIYNYDNLSYIMAKHSLFEGFSTFNTTWNTQKYVFNQGNNLGSDPKFFEASSGDYRLVTGSPALGAGDQVNGKNIGSYQNSSGIAPVPTINTSAQTVDFGSVDLSSTISNKSFTLSGNYLQGNITVTAGSNFSLSKDNTTFGSSLTFTPVAGSVASQTVYIKFIGTSKGTINENVTLTSSNSTTRTVTLKAVASHAPVSANTTLNVFKGTVYNFISDDFKFSDQDAGDVLSKVKIVTLPAKGSLFLDNNSNATKDAGEGLAAGQEVPVSDISKLKYLPSDQLISSTYSSFTYTVSDEVFFSAPAKTVTVSTYRMISQVTNTANTKCVDFNGSAVITKNNPLNNSLTISWTAYPSEVAPTGWSAANLLHGSYTVHVKDEVKNYIDTESFTIVNSSSNINITSTSSPVTSCKTPNGFIHATATGGSGNYTYSWTGPNGFTSSLSSITGLSSGVYSLTATDNTSGCFKTNSYTITNTASSIEATISEIISNTSCIPPYTGSIKATISGTTSSVSYSWSGPNSFYSDKKDITSLAGGEYTLTATETATGCISTATVTVDNIATASVTVKNATVILAKNTKNYNLENEVSITPAGGTIVFSGSGITNNYFSAVGLAGQTIPVSINYEAGVCRQTASLNIQVLPNQSPNDLILSNGEIQEEKPSGTIVGVMSTTDPDDETHSYTLVAGEGDTNNSLFSISNTHLITTAKLDYETTPFVSIRIRSTDNEGLYIEKILVITVQDIAESSVPTNIVLSNTEILLTISSNTVVGTLSTTDAEGGAMMYELVNGEGDTDNGLFVIDGASIKTSGNFTIGGKETLSIRIRVTDLQGYSFEKSIVIIVNNITGIEGRLETDVKIYPNPVASYLTISLKNNRVNNYKVKIFDVSGRELTDIKVGKVEENIIILNLEKVKPGLYFVEIQQDNYRLVKLFVKL